MRRPTCDYNFICISLNVSVSIVVTFKDVVISNGHIRIILITNGATVMDKQSTGKYRTSNFKSECQLSSAAMLLVYASTCGTFFSQGQALCRENLFTGVADKLSVMPPFPNTRMPRICQYSPRQAVRPRRMYVCANLLWSSTLTIMLCLIIDINLSVPWYSQNLGCVLSHCVIFCL